MPVEVQIAEGLLQSPAAEIETSWIEAAWQHLADDLGAESLQGDVYVRICDAEESQQLNATYRNKDYATNVLSFGADLPPEAGVLGDLALCWPVLQREAQQQGKTVQAHGTHLVIHGLLHLLGHDHEAPAAAVAMEAIEVRVLAGMGIEDPYAAIE